MHSSGTVVSVQVLNTGSRDLSVSITKFLRLHQCGTFGNKLQQVLTLCRCGFTYTCICLAVVLSDQRLQESAFDRNAHRLRIVCQSPIKNLGGGGGGLTGDYW